MLINQSALGLYENYKLVLKSKDSIRVKVCLLDGGFLEPQLNIIESIKAGR